MDTYGVSLVDDIGQFETFSSADAAEDYATQLEQSIGDVERWRAIEDYESASGRVERPGWRSVDYFA